MSESNQYYDLVPAQAVGSAVVNTPIGGSLKDKNGATSDNGLGTWYVYYKGTRVSMAELSELCGENYSQDMQSQAVFIFSPEAEGEWLVTFMGTTERTQDLTCAWNWNVQHEAVAPPADIGKANLAVSIQNNQMLKKLVGDE